MSEYLSDINLPDDYIQSPELDDSFIEMLAKKFASLNLLSFEEICYSKLCIREDFDYSEYILTKRFETILREMKIRMYNNVCTVKSHAFCHFSIITLLFGLCSSQSSIIFRAFFGTSLSRIPSL